VAAVLALAFVLRSARHPAPVMELGLWRVRSFSVANTATLVYAMGFFAMFLCSALFLTNVWGYSTFRAGLAIAPGPATAGIVGALGGRLADRWGQRVLLVPGQLLFAAGVLWLAFGVDTTPAFLTLWLPAFVLTGLGVGLSLPSLSSAAVASLPPGRLATGGAVNNTARQVGAVLGVAILIAIVGRPDARGALDAFRDGFIFCAACAVTCSAIALGLGRVRAHTEPAAAPSTDLAPAA
jgi:MFS family permease